MSDRRPPDAIEPPDPFEGLVLDEEFVRSATVSEPSARARMLAERWRHEPPVDPGGRRWSRHGGSGGRWSRTRFGRRPRPDRPGRLDRTGRRTGLPGRLRGFGSLSRGEQWSAVLGVLIVLLVVGGVLFGPNRAHTPQLGGPPPAPGSPRPSEDRALSGGGTSTGSRCGSRGYHHFPDAARPATADGASGPAAVLSADVPGEFTFDLLISPGRSGQLALASPLGRGGVAVEIEGPNGLVAGAYGLPATVNGAAAPNDATGPGDAPAPNGGRSWTVPAQGLAAHVVLPVAAL